MIAAMLAAPLFRALLPLYVPLVIAARALKDARRRVEYLAQIALHNRGRPEEGGMWWTHWQNLSRDDGEGDLPIHGRAWLRWGDSEGLRLSWNLRSSFAHVGASIDGSDGAEVGIKAALPPVALWLSLESWPLLRDMVARTGDREVSVSVHDGAIWWSLWMNPDDTLAGEPRWRRGSFHVVDALLGEERAERRTLFEQDVRVAFAEGSYPARVKLEQVDVSRARWPFATRHRVGDVKVERGVPIPGKGENAWDCDEDALYGQSGPARSIAEATANFTASVVQRRLERGGRDWRPESAAAGQEARA